MSVIRVIDPGISSIQDLGRLGLQRYGVAPAGAMDLASIRLGNRILGNPEQSAAIEIGPIPCALAVEGEGMRGALVGANRHLRLGQRTGPLNETFVVSDGEVLTLGRATSGMFSYLCFAGGIRAASQFASQSSDEKAGLGLPFPRRLRCGDQIEVNAAQPWKLERAATGYVQRDHDGPIRIVMGPQNDHFFPETVQQFLTSRWQVSIHSNRMCYRLDGPQLAHAKGYNIVSDATVKGSIQIAGNGQPFVLMADRGTVGGYPKIATIASIDIDRFAQTPPGQALRFKAITVAEAQALLRDNSHPARIVDKRSNPTVNLEAVAAFNLAGDVTDAFDASPA